MVDLGLDGKIVCLTGGNNPKGIGAAIARAFAAQGASVFIHFFRQHAGSRDTSVPKHPGEDYYRHAQTSDAGDLVQEIKRNGGLAEAWEADLAVSSAACELIDRAEQAFGSVDVLINNAALCEPDTFKPDDHAAHGLPMRKFTAETHDRHFSVNSRAPALLMAEFARRHVARDKHWGRIINISTDAASGFPDEISYWASKHALESYSRAAAAELGAFGITVNVASLGPIQTGWISRELESTVAPATPLGRIGNPEDVADVVLLLASVQARWLTGQLIYVGGGHRMPL